MVEPPAPVPAPVSSPGALRWLLIVVAVAAMAAVLYPRATSHRSAGPGGFILGEDGKPVSVDSRLATVTLVHFWASWCPPCRTELPAMVRYARAVASSGVKVLFVAVAEEPRVARRFLAADDLDLYFDPTWDVAHRFGTDALPETHVVVDGRVVRSFVGGANWDDPQLRSELQKWTATPTSAAP